MRPFKNYGFAIFLTGLFLCSGYPTLAQQVLIDRGVRADGLWCFPLATDTLAYLYLPEEARLAFNESQDPQFSMVRYVVNTTDESGSQSTISEAEGGAIVHFLVEYYTPEQRVQAAERELRRLTKEEAVELRGPIVFDEGHYSVISSVLSADGTEQEANIVHMGQAPVLESSRVALTFELDPTASTLLTESLKMTTSDVSVLFNMTFSGLTEAYDAELSVNWSQVHNTMGGRAGGSLYFIGADVEASFDEMLRNHAIELTTSGSDGVTEGLVNVVYDKLLELMFRPVKPEKLPKEGGLMKALAQSIGAKGLLSSWKTTGFGLNVGYEMKELKSEGTSVMRFNSRTATQRHHVITFNAGNLHEKYGQDDRFFSTKNLEDPAFQQREVHIGVDGALYEEFDQLVNSVSVTMRKQHGNGEQTVREFLVDRSFFADSSSTRLIYGSKEDADRLAWLEYQYRTKWQFQGGESFETDWVSERASMINLFTPYERRTIQLVGDTARLESQGVRAVVARVSYPFFDKNRSVQLVVRSGESIDDKSVDITLPANQFDYEYTLTWYLEGGQQRSLAGRDASGLLFVDEVPGD